MSASVPSPLLRAIDRWVGPSVCLILSLVEKLLRLCFSQSAPAEAPRKILFVKCSNQGSTVLAQSALRRAISLVGSENVYWVVFEEKRFILDVLGLIPEANILPLRHGTLTELVKEGFAALEHIRALQIDTVVDLEFFARFSAAFTWLTRAPRRIGFHTFFGEGPYRGDLMTHRLLYNPYLHISQIFEQMVMATAADPQTLPTWDDFPPPLTQLEPCFVPKPGEVEQLRAILRQSCGTDSRFLILLHPNPSDRLSVRKWPAERYAGLAQRLLERFPEARVVLTGAVSEAGEASEIVRQVGSPRCVSLAGRTTLRQWMVLSALSELLITSDSSAAQFAALTPIHVLTLFGPETPSRFGAPTARNTTLWLGLACSPCVNACNSAQSPCRNNRCMQGIPVERVFTEAVRILEARQEAARDQEPG